MLLNDERSAIRHRVIDPALEPDIVSESAPDQILTYGGMERPKSGKVLHYPDVARATRPVPTAETEEE
jgi:hypothetical protein